MLRLTRPHAFLFSPLAYEVFIDGISRGKLIVNETKLFPLEEGEHTVHIKIDGYKGPSSETLHFEVKDGGVHAEIVSALTWWWLIVPVAICLTVALILFGAGMLQNFRDLVLAAGIGCLIGGLSSMAYFKGKYLKIKQIGADA